VDNKEQTMNINSVTLAQYVKERNAIRAMFRNRPLDLNNAQDRQEIADEIDCALSPENLTCDGELSRSAVDRKYRMLTRCARELQKLDPAVKFYEFA
jgi:hypothetical protein